MLKTRCVLIVLVAACFLGAVPQAIAQAPGRQSEEALLAVLKSDAPLFAKTSACRELVIVGTKRAVPVLAELLADEKLSHMARYALEPIPDPAVDQALREAAGKLQGRLLVGVVGSIGARRDGQAIDLLAKFVAGADREVAAAAAMSLGMIGTAPAAKALDGALNGSSGAVREAVADGMLRCGQAMHKRGQSEQAVAIFDRVRAADLPRHIRMGATSGAILARQGEGLPLLVESLRSADDGMFVVAIQSALELKGENVTRALAGELEKLAPAKQVVLLQTLGARGDVVALPAVAAFARNGKDQPRLTAIRILPQFKDTSVAPMLFELSTDAERPVAQAAQTSLVNLPGKEVDTLLLNRVQSQNVPARRLAMDMLAQRRVLAVIPVLVKAAEEPDAQIRASAIRALGELAGPEELPALLAILTRAAEGDISAAEAALASTTTRIGDANASSAAVVAAIPNAPLNAKRAMLRVLRSIGGPASLKAVRAASTDANAEVRDGAVRVLADWTTPDAAPDLLQIAKTSDNATYKVLALRGYIRLARDRGVSQADKLTMCREASALAQRDEEKRQILGVLGDVPSPQALEMVLPHLATPAIKDEAAVAAVGIAEKIIQNNPAPVAQAMQKVIDAAPNTKMADRAKALLEQANRRTR